MGSEKSSPVLTAIEGGTGATQLAPPWSRNQVTWLGRGFFIARIAGDELSRWLLGAGARWDLIFPHEKTFRRSAEDKNLIMGNLKFNPWPTHLGNSADSKVWRQKLEAAVSDLAPVYDTGHVTLWRMGELPIEEKMLGKLIVLDGHHSCKAQQHLKLPRLFAWTEPLFSEQLNVRAIHRAGALMKWIEECVASGDLREIKSAPSADAWNSASSMAFEVVQVHRRWWCEIARKVGEEAAIDALARLAKGRAFLKASSNFEEIVAWMERSEADTGLRLPPPDKQHIRDRALARRPFPQKSTYFYPKLPFGLLVQDLREV